VNGTAARTTAAKTCLHIVPDPPAEAPRAEAGDLALLGVLAAVGLVPVVGELAGGSWGAGTLGAAALLTLLSGRELVSHLRQRLRARA
jgi:hypothetical protein